MGGRWDADRKVWVIDLSKVEAATKSSTGLYDANNEQIAKLTNATVATHHTTAQAGTYVALDGVRVCARCHTVCYGDCSAN